MQQDKSPRCGRLFAWSRRLLRQKARWPFPSLGGFCVLLANNCDIARASGSSDAWYTSILCDDKLLHVLDVSSIKTESKVHMDRSITSHHLDAEPQAFRSYAESTRIQADCRMPLHLRTRINCGSPYSRYTCLA